MSDARGNFSRSLSYFHYERRSALNSAQIIASNQQRGGSCMSSNANGLANGKNGKNGKKRRRRILWATVATVVLLGAGYGVRAALSPDHRIDPSKLASLERGDLARVVVATGKIQPLSKVAVTSKASGIVNKL